MSPPPSQYSGPKDSRPAFWRALCRLRPGGHEWRSIDVLDLPSGWLACTDKRCQRCGLWLVRGQVWR